MARSLARGLGEDGHVVVSGLARGIYSELSDSFNPNAALLVSDRWETGIGDIGVLVNASYTKTKYRNQNLQAGAMVPFLTVDGARPPITPGSCGGNPNPWGPLERLFTTDCRAVTAANPQGDIWTPGLDAGLPTEAGSTLNVNGVEVPYYLSRDAVISSDLYGERERPAVNAASSTSSAGMSSWVYLGTLKPTRMRSELIGSPSSSRFCAC